MIFGSRQGLLATSLDSRVRFSSGDSYSPPVAHGHTYLVARVCLARISDETPSLSPVPLPNFGSMHHSILLESS
jgi:hypothetical protein